MQDWQEAIGFLCRWCLLALAGAAVLLVGWAGASASASLPAELEATIILPDGLWGRTERAHLTGFFGPSASTGHPEIALCCSPDTELLLAPASAERIYPRLAVHHVGVNEVRVVGIPYSAQAFNRTEAVLQVVAPGREAWLVDASMALRAARGGDADFAECLRMIRADEPAFFHDGPVEQLPQVRLELRQAYGRTPCVFSTDKDGRPNTPLHTAWTLGPDGKHPRKPILVTGDSPLGVALARSGFTVHLLGAEAAGAELPATLHAHESSRKFKEYLKAKPIRH